MKRARIRAPLVFVLAVSTLAGAVAYVPVAPADTGAPSLAGENLHGTGGEPNFAVDASGNPNGSCNPDGTSTLSYHETGVATGPYPGTFEETGTFTVGPQPTLGGAPLVAFHATFHIDSLVGQVDGTKDVILGPSSVGQCTVQQNVFPLPGCPFPDDPVLCTGTVTTVFMSALATYQATINSPLGTFSDTGTTLAQGSTTYRRSVCCASASSGFNEFFLTSQGVTPLGPAVVVLSPPEAMNQVGTSHTVTATVTNSTGGPVGGVRVLFTVEGSVSTSGSCTTDAAGRCDFTYQGPALPGADLITGCADSNGNGTAEPAEPCGVATKVWILPASTPGQVTGGGYVLNATATDKIAFGFNAQSDTITGNVKGNCNVIDHASGTQIKCLSVTTVVQGATHATFFGNATVNGTATTYRIDVDDLSEPGTADTFKIQTDSGYIAGGVLVGGNIQIHK